MDKKKFVNSLTILRIVLSVVMFIIGIKKHYVLMFLIGIVTALSDFFDGFLARKWNVTSRTGAILDTIADKVFAILTIGFLITKNKLFIIALIFEGIIALSNLYYMQKNNIVKSLMIGKIKTTVLFVTILVAILNLKYASLHRLFLGLFYTSLNLQIICIISYLKNYLSVMHKPSITDNEMHNKIMNEEYEEVKDDDLDKTVIIENLEKLASEYDYNNETDDIY